MVVIRKNRFRNSSLLLFFLTSLIVLLSNVRTNAQEMPPRPIGVSPLQTLNFGAFSLFSDFGGTVTIYPSGSRSAFGDIILVNLGYPYFPAIFEIEGNPGSIVHFLAGPDVTLTSSSGGTLELALGPSEPGDPIIITVAPPGRIQVRVGGTLSVADQFTNPPGSYTGSFMVMFIQE